MKYEAWSSEVRKGSTEATWGDLLLLLIWNKKVTELQRRTNQHSYSNVLTFIHQRNKLGFFAKKENRKRKKTCKCALTGMAGSSNVSSAATVAGEHIPRLGTMTPMLTGVRNTPYVTNKQGVNIYCEAPGLASSFTLYLSIMTHISKLTFSKFPMRPCSTALRSARWSSI